MWISTVSSWLFKWQCSSLVWSCWPLPSLWLWVSSLSVYAEVSQRDSTSRFNCWSVMSLLSHWWLWLSMEYYGLTMHGECVCVWTRYRHLCDGRTQRCMCVCVCDGIVFFCNFKNVMNYAVEETKNIERYNYLYASHWISCSCTMCVIFLFVHYILQDSVCLSGDSTDTL